MNTVLRIAALLCFAIAVVICTIVDAPDVLDIFAFGFSGLAFWVGSTLVPER